MKKSDKLRRRHWSRKPLPRFLIVCEGTVTEPHYFRELRRLERVPVDLDIRAGGVPKTLVERAASANQSQFWCVFDIDEHPFVPEAKQQARDNGIQVAVSNPCFEFWLLLHFQDQTAHIERDRVAHTCREHMPGYKKKPPCETLAPHQQEATARAIYLDNRQESNGNPGGNPSTGVYRLVQQIKAVRESPTIRRGE
jgi:hypothetical protein